MCIELRFDEFDGDFFLEDVVFEVKVDDYFYFKCKGFNIYMELLVMIDEVVFGLKVEVLIFDGLVIFKILFGLNGDMIFWLCGKGL